MKIWRLLREFLDNLVNLEHLRWEGVRAEGMLLHDCLTDLIKKYLESHSIAQYAI